MPSVYKRKSQKQKKQAKWIVSWYDAESGLWRDKTAYTDKGASMELGRRLEREAANRAEGLVDPYWEQRRRAINEHLQEYIDGLTGANRSPRYVLQQQNRIQRVIDRVGAKRLQDLDPVKVERFLSGLQKKGRPVSGVTRNEYLSSVKAFTAWAVAARRVETDPLASLKRIERQAVKRTHPRRALTTAEVAKLLEAAARRPERERRTIRRGPQKGELSDKVKPAVLGRARRLGQERRLAYLLAVWSGLRRSEVKALRWGDVDLGTNPPRIRLRAETTKSKRADSLVIHPQLAEELRKLRSDRTTAGAPLVSAVPDMKAMRADLREAGIEPGDEVTGFVDFHSLRKTLSTMMAAGGMSQRARQAHMRHTDPRLTENTYMDEKLLPIAAELTGLPAIGGGAATVAASAGEQNADGEGVALQGDAGNMQETSGLTGPSMAQAVIEVDLAERLRELRPGSRNPLFHQGFGPQGHDPAPCGTGSQEKAGEGIRTLDIHVGNVTLYH